MMTSSPHAFVLVLRRRAHQRHNNLTASAHPLVSSDFSMSHSEAPSVPQRNNRLAKLKGALYSQFHIAVNCGGMADNFAFVIITPRLEILAGWLNAGAGLGGAFADHGGGRCPRLSSRREVAPPAAGS